MQPAATTPATPTPTPATASTAYDWAVEFHAFTLQHLVTLTLFVGLMIGACWLGRRWLREGGERNGRVPPLARGALPKPGPGVSRPGEGDTGAGHFRPHPARPDPEWRLRLIWAWTTIAWQTMATVWYLLPRNFDWYESLPLHLCDLAAWVAPFALLTQKRWLRTLLYFWGIGLSTQAFLTPVVEGGHGDFRYWLFFIGHTQIVGSAIYDVVVLGYRPNLRDWGVVTLLSLAWIVPVTAFNLLMDVNYGYTGRMTPGGTTVLDYLGPWPWRLGTMFVLTQVLWGVVCVPWVVADRWLFQQSPE
ncbi:MAG: TIGR02206 family membrane protein [Planctomycetota bacterium]|nr:TIGR02206 family membrane protein [Planctomycetota bacterium]